MGGVTKSGARFNPDKAKWFNEQYLRQLPAADAIATFRETAGADVFEWPDDRCKQVLSMMLERVSFMHEVGTQRYLFDAPQTIDETLVAKKWKPETAGYLQQ